MSEENKVKTSEKPAKTAEQKEKTLEIIVAIFLGVTALLTSWALSTAEISPPITRSAITFPQKQIPNITPQCRIICRI